MGDETVEARAERLAEVALASWRPTVAGARIVLADQLRAFFVAGFLACAQDEVKQ
jgi:hypothetical protein